MSKVLMGKALVGRGHELELLEDEPEPVASSPTWPLMVDTMPAVGAVRMVAL